MTAKTKPAVECSADITTSDSTTYKATRGVLLEVAGDLVVTMADGNDATIPGLAAGVIHPLSVTKVKAATTATGISLFW